MKSSSPGLFKNALKGLRMCSRSWENKKTKCRQTYGTPCMHKKHFSINISQKNIFQKMFLTKIFFKKCFSKKYFSKNVSQKNIFGKITKKVKNMVVNIRSNIYWCLKYIWMLNPIRPNLMNRKKCCFQLPENWTRSSKIASETFSIGFLPPIVHSIALVLISCYILSNML